MDNLRLKVENIVAKGEIARHYVFKKQSAAEASESVYMRERVKQFATIFQLYQFTFPNVYFILYIKSNL